MKIRRFALKNVTSYRERVDFEFDDRLNILIGPNGGGKSNLQKALALVLSNYFIHQYDFKSDDNEAKADDIVMIDSELERLIKDRIFVLRHGEIEDYLPPGHQDVKDIVDLTVDRSWVNKVPDAERRAALGKLICEILLPNQDERERLISEMRSGAVHFPEPLA